MRTSRPHALRPAVLAMAVGLLAALPASASASTALVDTVNNQMVFLAGPGEANDVTVSDSTSNYRVTDVAGTITAGSGCTQSGATVLCPQNQVNSVRLELGDGDDVASTSATVRVYENGGAGNDRLNGGLYNDVLSGQDGDDQLLGNSGADLMDGGAGVDRVSYEARSNPVHVDTDGFYDDGEFWEWDNINSTVEVVVGGAGADTFVGTAAANEFRGGPGDDVLDGMDGADLLVGDAGNDSLYGREGVDAFEGGDGDDKVFSRDSGTAERVDCGNGADTATADREDTASACEVLDVPPALPAPTNTTTTTTIIQKSDDPAPLPVRIEQSKLKMGSNRVIEVKLSCGSDQTKGCRGKVVLEAKIPSGEARASRRSGPANKVILAKSKFRLRRGRTKTLKVRASRRAVRKVFTPTRKRVKATMTVTMRNSDRSVTKIIKPVTLAATKLLA